MFVIVWVGIGGGRVCVWGGGEGDLLRPPLLASAAIRMTPLLAAFASCPEDPIHPLLMPPPRPLQAD